MGREDIEGREIAKSILKSLSFTRFKEIKGSIPFDLAASNGKERYLIDIKYADEEKPNTAGFPLPWIYRTKSVIKDARMVQKGWKFLVMVMLKQGDKVSYLFLGPYLEERWFKCESLGTERGLENLKDELIKWDR